MKRSHGWSLEKLSAPKRSEALTTSDDKYFIEAYKVYFHLIWLNGQGDVAGSADYGQLIPRKACFRKWSRT
jgi:hypothetical protein